MYDEKDKDEHLNIDEAYQAFMSSCIEIHSKDEIQAQKQGLEINAGHINDFSLVEIPLKEGYILPAVCKKTNAIEPLGYLEIWLKQLTSGSSDITAKLFQFQIFQKSKGKHKENQLLLDTQDTLIYLTDDSLLKTIELLIEEIRQLHTTYSDDLIFYIYIEQLIDLSKNSLEIPSVDAKVGNKTFSDDEADYNQLKRKSLINKTQMTLNESSARWGGAENFQIANSSNVVVRLFNYSSSLSTLNRYFNQFNTEKLNIIKEQLKNIALFIFHQNIAAIGASLYYFGNNVRLIDLAHYMSADPITSVTQDEVNLNYYHKNLLTAINEQIDIIDSVISKKQSIIEHVHTQSEPQLPFQKLDTNIEEINKGGNDTTCSLD
ncbi:MAG: hypothetical protein EP298_12480 [Gammaproteobacteria bacterium]|nr:MAG: hypothetical protein EP298_12480 [Gammaproteobacteria bacterium]UTW41817.1 hypothetical protein KFE69_09930 [bacterium SCSIO 12844]